MSGTVSTRWYFTDWMSDEGVRACSLTARGLWMDLLCIAGSNRGDEHGFVLIAGKVPTTEYLARRLGASVDEIKSGIQELVDNRVCNRDRRGAIYSRRMVRAEKSRNNGKLGGEINRSKTEDDPRSKYMRTKENKKQPPPPVPEPEPEPEPKESKKEDSTAAPPKVAKRATMRTRIPDRAVLAEGPNLDFALSKGFSHATASTMFEEFRDYHIGKGNLMADWAAAWRTWVRNQIKFKRGVSNGNAGAHQPARGADAVLAAARRRVGAGDRSDGLGERGADALFTPDGMASPYERGAR